MVFYGGSQLTLVNNTFAREQNFTKVSSTYAMQGIGGTITHYESRKDGFLWNIPLHRNTGKIDWVVAYGVNKILDPVGRASIPYGEQEFPHLPPAIFKRIPHKRLDLLVGLSDLKIHPGCSKGFGKCSDCEKNRCCFQSHYGHGWVCIGRLSQLGSEDVSLTSSIRRVALCKAPPTPSDLFFQAEQLGASPIEKCVSCKTTINECRICNIETSVLFMKGAVVPHDVVLL